MWILVIAILAVFLFLCRKGYVLSLVIAAAGIGAAVFMISFFHFGLVLSFAAFNAACSFFIWYLILNILYTILKRAKV